VLLVVDRPNDRLTERIRAEVAGLGLTIVTLEPWRTHQVPGPLEAVARREHAAAVIRTLPTGQGVEVWMADATSGRSLLRQLIVDESAEGPNEGLVALQTAELLRTSLLSQPREPAPAAVAPPSPSTTTAASSAGAADSSVTIHAGGPETEPETGVDASFGVLFSPGAGDAALQVWLSLHRTLTPRLAVAVDASGPLRPATQSGPEGSARVGAYLVGAVLLARLTALDSALYAAAGGGLAVVRVGAEGQAAPPLVATSASGVTGAVYLRADAGVQARPWLRLGARAVAGAAVPSLTLRFAGNDAGAWGRPFIAAFAVAQLCWR
jgi:hypothetical protein